MNYLKHYNLLIEKAKSRKLEGYREKHHVVPRCMGGTNDPSNIIELTAREHFVAHLLLFKHHKTTELARAFALMCSNKTGERYRSSYFYESGKKSAFGLGLSENHKRKISEALKLYQRTESHNKNIAKGLTGKKLPAKTREKMSLASKGKPKSEEHRKNLSKAKRKNPPSSTIIKLECPHCKKVGQKANMLRWHFDRCKQHDS